MNAQKRSEGRSLGISGIRESGFPTPPPVLVQNRRFVRDHPGGWCFRLGRSSARFWLPDFPRFRPTGDLPTPSEPLLGAFPRKYHSSSWGNTFHDSDAKERNGSL